MGCGESKIKEISLSPENNGDSGHESGSEGRLSSEFKQAKLVDDDQLPNRLLAAIPVSDLGDSLDSRHLGESLNLGNSTNGG